MSVLGLGCLLSACTTILSKPTETVTWEDKNSDGVVDYEKHHVPHGADTDWVLVDTDYDGIFDKKIRYGYAVIEEDVSIPAPRVGQTVSD